MVGKLKLWITASLAARGLSRYGGKFGAGGTLLHLWFFPHFLFRISPKWRNRVSHADSDSAPTIIEEDIFPAIQRISKTWMSARLKSPLANWNNWISRPSELFLS
ncbi:hypothetical protein Tco_1287482 [Tanacetum coccineum]